MNYATPGVIVEEINTFPPSVAPVETAVPAFIGYTERAVDTDGSTLTLQAKRITSLLDYETHFGGAFLPASYAVQIDTAADNALGSVTPREPGGTARRYYLYPALRHYFAHGGGPCWIVSVGPYPTVPAFGDPASELRGGLEVVRNLDAPTLLVAPDAVSLDDANLGAMQVACLAQCAELQDRFTVMDLSSGRAPAGIGVDPMATFRQNVGTTNLRYGAAYYPWVRTIYRPDVHFRDIAFVTPADIAIPDGTIDGLGTADENLLVTALRTADAEVDAIVGAVDVSGWVGAPVTLDRRTFPALTEHYAALTAAIRALPEPLVVADLIQAFSNLITLPRALTLALAALEAGPALSAEVTDALTSLSEDPGLQAAIDALIALEKNADILPIVAAGRVEGDVDTDYGSLDGTDWISTPLTTGIGANADSITPPGGDERATALSAAAAIAPHFERIAASVGALFEAADYLADGAEVRLFDGHPVMTAVREAIWAEATLLPPSGAVTGIYCAVDRSRGVWKAPANVSLTDVTGPTVRLNDEAQGTLNVHTSGKSVNALRVFAGKGTLVWGARTLAGNDAEWRYVNTRRFFNMAEEAIQTAAENFTFEPNTAATWVRVKAMIENFLTVQWRQGALMGATADQAFHVRVGLGQTMTAQDILEGRMIVDIGMAVVRPAEFIVLKFAQKMQVS